MPASKTMARVRSAVSVQHYCIVPVNRLFSMLVTIRPASLPKRPLSVWMAGALVLIAWAAWRRRSG
jgi:hypothetical protein